MKQLFFIATVLFVFASCSSDSGELRTANGYLVELHRDAEGAVAQRGDVVTFDYEVSNGETVVFNSREMGGAASVEIPEQVNPRDQASAVLEAFLFASAGDSLTVYFPTDSLSTPMQGFEGKDNVIYHMVVNEVKDKATFEAEQQAKAEANQATYLANKTFLAETLEAYKAGELDGELIELPSGLKLAIHEPGEGETASSGDGVVAHYIGVMQETGVEFDNSYMRGETFDFIIDGSQVIQGWHQGFAQLKPGAKATLFIPSELGYGERGAGGDIPPNADLAFFVELIDVQPAQ